MAEAWFNLLVQHELKQLRHEKSEMQKGKLKILKPPEHGLGININLNYS